MATKSDQTKTELPSGGEEETQEMVCGGCGFYPKSLQKCANSKVFLLCFSLKNVIQGMMFTYIVGITTSLEKHFQWPSRTTGLISTVAEVGQILAAVFLAYYGSKGNKPRWIGFGLLTVVLSCFVAYSSYLFIPPPLTISDIKAGTDSNLCKKSLEFVGISDSNSILDRTKPALAKASARNKYSVFSGRNTTAPSLVPGGDFVEFLESEGESTLLELEDKQCTVNTKSNQLAFFIFVLVKTASGIGSIVVYTLGAPYLDDSLAKKDSPLYFGITISVRIIGPVLGFIMSSAVLKVYIIPTEDPGITPGDPRWIGAWWIGFLVIGTLLIIPTVIMSLFPSKLGKAREVESGVEQVKQKEEQEKEVTSNNNKIEKLKEQLMDLKTTIFRLIKNPVLMFSCCSNILYVLGLAGYFVWLPKYYEHQFRFSKSQASLYSGMAGTASLVVGILIGGIVMKKFQPKARAVALWTAGSKYAYAVGILILMINVCGFSGDLPGSYKDDTFELHMACGDASCQCSTDQYLPVCYEGESFKRTYFSPCHASCASSQNDTKPPQYTDCSCVPDETYTVTKGYCEKDCNYFYSYTIILAVTKFIVSTSVVGNFIIDLRCVDPKDKSIALGFLVSMSSLFTLQDYTCAKWWTSWCAGAGQLDFPDYWMLD